MPASTQKFIGPQTAPASDPRMHQALGSESTRKTTSNEKQMFSPTIQPLYETRDFGLTKLSKKARRLVLVRLRAHNAHIFLAHPALGNLLICRFPCSRTKSWPC